MGFNGGVAEVALNSILVGTEYIDKRGKWIKKRRWKL